MSISINQIVKGGLMMVLVAFMASCSEIEEQAVPMNESTLKTIPEVLKTMETGEEGENLNARKKAGNTYATFNAALGKSGLASVFAKNDLTVFAPNDAAFADLGLNPGNIGKLPGLKNILLYHVVAGSVFAADLTEGFVPTINGAAVKISLAGGPMVNDANIVMVDKKARNGVIHGIDAVLLPPTINLMELVNSNPNFSILKFALEATDLDGPIATVNNLTVFAPTDAAFGALLVELGFGSLEELVAAVGIDGLREVLKYHVFAGGRVYSSDLTNTTIKMFSGQDVTVDVSGPKLIDVRGRESMITATDIQATNGVVHVLDKVILNF